jgi:hypothetical protein
VPRLIDSPRSEPERSGRSCTAFGATCVGSVGPNVASGTGTGGKAPLRSGVLRAPDTWSSIAGPSTSRS